MRFHAKYAAAAAALCTTLCAAAQTPRISGRIEPDSIMIGDRFIYTIEVERDQVQVVTFPTFGGGEASPIELVREYPVDTLSHEGRRLHLRKRYEMTAFDEGHYMLGRAVALYADKNILDTLRGEEELTLDVGTFTIDSTAMAQGVFDLKPQRKMPLRFGEFSGYLLWSLLAAALLGIAAYFVIRALHRRGRRLRDIFKPAPPLPPHVAAIQALETLRNRKLWQNNRHKEYYSGLSDILRTYIAGSWGIGAMEMTSEQIIAEVGKLDLPQKNVMDLTSVLQDADLVKFAKAAPEGEHNETSYFKAYYFVEETKPVEEPATDDEQEVINSKL